MTVLLYFLLHLRYLLGFIRKI